jgi:hypothetical protein
MHAIALSWLWLRFKARGIDLTAVAVTATDGFRIPPISQLRKVLVVNIAGHRDHEARRLFDRILIGREVYMFCLRILFMAVSAWRAQLLLIPMHQSIEIVPGNILGQHFKVCRLRMGDSLRRNRIAHCLGGPVLQCGRDGNTENGAAHKECRSEA